MMSLFAPGTRNGLIFRSILVAYLCATSAIGITGELEFSGEASAQYRLFQHDPQFPVQEQNTASIALQPKLVWFSEAGNNTLSVELFGRLDQHDEDRSHGDIREFLWEHLGENWVLRTGLGIVFWGVTESQHLIDVINQTDNLEGVDGEDKLGQPMLNLSLERDWGIVDLFWLPGFRERKFAGAESRLRPGLRITSKPVYEDSDEDRHQDWAVRWSHYYDIFDFAISHFSGTQRTPAFSVDISSGTPTLVPYYPLVDETAVMLQATTDAWLWKFESKYIDLTDDHGLLAVGGIEYTFFDMSGSGYDLGLIAEYHFDDRGESGSILENDMMLGARLALNDIDSTELLVGGIFDLDEDTKWLSLEASKRFGDSWKGALEIRTFSGNDPTQGLDYLNQDDFVQFDLSYYF